MTLSAASGKPVTVAYAEGTGGTATAGTDYMALASGTLTFAAGETSKAIDVTVTGDDLDEHDETIVVTLSSLMGATFAPNGAMGTGTITDDDDAPTLSLALSDPISGSPNTIKELATAPPGERRTTVTASLSAVSGAAVAVTVSASASTNAAADDFSLSAERTLTIAAGDTTSTGTVTITAVDDKIDSIVDTTVADKKVAVSAAVAGTASQVAAATDSGGNPTVVAELLILENDNAKLVLDPVLPVLPADPWLTVAEGSTKTFTVALKSEPTENVMVAVASANDGEGKVSSGAGAPAASTTLTFTASNWNTAQTVTLHGATDDVVDGNKDYQLTLDPSTAAPASPATDAYDLLGKTRVNAQTTDADSEGLSLSKTAVTVTEGGTGQTFAVALTSRPTAAVTVTATSGDDDEVQLAVGAGDAEASQTLTFTGDNWNQQRILRVKAVDDAVDEPDGASVAVTLDPTSPDVRYNALPDGTVTVSVNDNDDAPTVTLSLSPTSISESGGVSTVAAKLSHPSSAATTVTVTVAAGYTVGSDAVIVIAAGETANAMDVATVAAVDDDVHQGAAGRSTTVTAMVANDQGAGSVTGAALTLTDDDDAPNAALSLSPTSISESGGVSTVSATLTHPSSAATTVTVTVAAGYTVGSDATIVIAPGETANATDVAAIAGVDNATDAPDRTTTVTATLTNSQGAGTVSGATLTLEDDDAAPGVTLTVSPAAVSENGGVSTVSATLTHPSSAVTTVTVTVAAGYTVGSDATIVIAAGETANAPDVATIIAVDNDVDADNDVTVTGTAANSQAAAESETMTVTGATLTLTDDDVAGFAVSPAPSATSRLRTTEAGGTATFTVTLATEPTGDVVLGVASSDTAEGTVLPSSLTFTATTWNTAQPVTLTGVDDAATDGDRNYTVILTGTSTVDANYNALSAVTMYAVNADNEDGLAVSSVTGQATEAGGTATFTVALNTRPSAAVTVTVTSRDADGNPDASEGTVSPSLLTFAATAWNTAQPVTVTGANDTIDDGTVTWAVRLDPSSGGTDYNGLSNVDVLVTTDDDDDAPGGDAGAGAVVDCGERRRIDGDGDALAPVGRGDDGDGDGGLRLLHGGVGRGDRDRGGVDGERHGRGDDRGGRQHDGRAGPDGDGDGDDHERPGHGRRDDHGGDGRGPDGDRRRPRAERHAFAEPGDDFRERRRIDGERGAVAPVERADDGDGDSGGGLLHGGVGRDHRDRGGRHDGRLRYGVD